jgi:hypothetical protein
LAASCVLWATISRLLVRVLSERPADLIRRLCCLISSGVVNQRKWHTFKPNTLVS